MNDRQALHPMLKLALDLGPLLLFFFANAKPVLFEPWIAPLIPDAVATGEQPHTVCPSHRWLPVPMAPPMAAHALGLPPFSIDDLATELEASMPAESAVVLVCAGVAR